MTFRAVGLSLALALSAATSAQDRPPLNDLAAHLEASPDDADARRQLAARYTEAGRPEAAVPHLVWLAAWRPSDPEVLRDLAQHLLWTEQTAAAADALDRLVALGAATDTEIVELAEIRTWDGGSARAVDLLDPFAYSRLDDARIQRAYAFALVAERDRRAIAQLDQALALQPDDAELLLESGALQRWGGDWGVARTRLQRARAIGLPTEGDARAAALLAGIDKLRDPSLTTRVLWTDDSNGVARMAAPVRLEVVLSPRLGLGVDGAGDRISSLDGSGEADAYAVVPFVAWTPVAVRVEAGVGVERAGGAATGVFRALVQRTWPGSRFALVRTTLESRTATDAAAALSGGLRRTTAQLEGYAEPRSTVTVFGTAAAHRYSDGNLRVQAAAAGRWLPLRAGRTGPRPAVALGPAVSILYDDSQIVYPTSQPYYTPSDLWTGSAGLAATAAPGRGVRFDGTVGLARQSGPFAATSLEYGLAVEVERGRNAVRLEARRSGSSAYSADVVGLTVRLRVP